jgi:hypothetical protein
MPETVEQTLARYLRAMVATLIKRRKNASYLCTLLDIDQSEARRIWHRYQ